MEEVKSEIPPKVLVIRLSSMGDVVLATSVLAPLRSAGFAVTFVTKAAFAPLLEGHPDIEEVFSFRTSQEFFRWLGGKDFSLIVDLQDSLRTRLWRPRFWFRFPILVARKERVREILILWFRLKHFFSFGRGGRAQKFRRLVVNGLGLPPPSSPLTSLPVPMAAAFEASLPKKDFAVLLPGSAWKGKEWPYFPQLAKILGEKVPVVALGGEKDLVCDEIAQASKGLSLRGKTSLRESVAILSKAKWVIGNDTGMVHVAEALGKDVVMIEGPTGEALGFSPYREGSQLAGLSLFCRPCSKSGKICLRGGSRKCLRDLSVQAVLSKIRGLPC